MPDTSVVVVKIRDLLMVTMPPDADDSAIASLQGKVLASMERSQARALILDISAVETLDSFFARTVSETAQMVRLMGGRTIIAGMRPAVAITATQLGLTLSQVETALTVDRAVDRLEPGSPEGRRP